MKPERQRVVLAEAMGRNIDPSCLNAMREAEDFIFKNATDDLKSMYYDYLILGAEGFPDRWECQWHATTANAAQRAEALLRTLGKWEES